MTLHQQAADAADNAQVLKAAALGAAGGFTDINTAGMLTSVRIWRLC